VESKVTKDNYLADPSQCRKPDTVAIMAGFCRYKYMSTDGDRLLQLDKVAMCSSNDVKSERCAQTCDQAWIGQLRTEIVCKHVQ
jgi:hypothetical protein